MVTQSFNSKVWQADDSITWTHGRHAFKFGGEYMRDIIKVFYSGNSGELGGMTFGPNFTASADTDPLKNTGEGMADFFLGLPTAFGRGLSSGSWTQTSNIFAGYAQDTWRLTDHLTLTLGLRYEAHTPWVEVNNQQTNFNPVTGEIEYAGQDGNSRALYDGTYGGKDFQPRLGFAWTPGWSGDRTVFRGAFTVSDYLEGTGTNLRLPLNPPYDGGSRGRRRIPNAISTATLANHDGVGWHHCAAACRSFLPQLLLLRRSNTSSLGPESATCYRRSVEPDGSAPIRGEHHSPGRVCWAGSLPPDGALLLRSSRGGAQQLLRHTSLHIAQPVFWNGVGPALLAAIDSTGGTVSGTQSNGRMMYNALQAVLQRTLTRGLQAQVSYTYAKCMSNNTGYYGTWPVLEPPRLLPPIGRTFTIPGRSGRLAITMRPKTSPPMPFTTCPLARASNLAAA